jgi:hypothetical protein
MYAASPAGADVAIETSLPVKTVEVVNLIEDRIKDGALDGIKLRGYEIRTLKLKPAPVR